jgi:hypothetical protein
MARLNRKVAGHWVRTSGCGRINGRWIAFHRSLGLGERAIDAIAGALEPFEVIVDELLASLPRDGVGWGSYSGVGVGSGSGIGSWPQISASRSQDRLAASCQRSQSG